MSKRNSIIIILVAAILIIGGLLYWYFSPARTQPTTTATTTGQGTFGGNNNGNNTNVGTSTQIGSGTGTVQNNIPALFHLYNNPISGLTFFTNRASTTDIKIGETVLRFTDRGNGNTYEYVPDFETGSPIRITNTTIPKIAEAVWSPTGDNAILRYLINDFDNIGSISLKIITGTSTLNVPFDMSQTNLPRNIKGLAINPTGNRIFSLFLKPDGSGSYGVESALDGTSEKQTFDSPVSFWNISWPTQSIITFTSKPTYQYKSSLFFFNTQFQTMDEILANITGLSTLTNNDGSLVAYSRSKTNAFVLETYDVKNKTSSNLHMPALADKCVWGIKNNKILFCAMPKIIPLDNYPDAWYQGIESFSDDIWSINTENGQTALVYQVGTHENASIDALNLSISPDDRYISFMNKSDLSLWLLDTKGIENTLNQVNPI